MRGSAGSASTGGEQAGEVDGAGAAGLDAVGLAGFDLGEEVGAADDLFEGGIAEPGEELADLFGDVEEEVDEHLGLAEVLGAEVFALGGDADGAGVEVALAGHFAAEGDEGGGAEAVAFRAEQGGDDDVAAGVEAAVGAEHDAAAEAVDDERFVGFLDAEFPGSAGVLDGGEGGSAGAAVRAGDVDDVGVGLGDAGGDGADALAGDEFDADAGVGVGDLEVVDQLGEVFDGVDVVVGGRGDEFDAGGGVAQEGDVGGDFVAGELAALAGLGALGDLDFDFGGTVEVGGGDAEAAGGDLLDSGVGVVLVAARAVAARVFAAFAGVGERADFVHGAGDVLVGFGAERAERHGAGAEAGGDGVVVFDVFDGDGGAVGLEVDEVAEGGGLAAVDHVGVLGVGLGFVVVGALDGFVEGAPDGGFVGVVVGVAAVLVPAAGFEVVGGEGVGVAGERVGADLFEADAADAGGGAGEGAFDDLFGDAERFVDLAAVVGGDGGDAHFGHDFEDAGVERVEVAGDGVVGAEGVEFAVGLECGDHLEREVGVDGVGAEADQAGDLVDVARVAGAGDDGGVEAPAVADEVVVDGGDGEEHGDGDAVGVDVLVGEDEQGVAVFDGVVDAVAECVEGGFEAGGAVDGGEGAADVGGGEAGHAEAAEGVEVAVDEDGGGEVDDAGGFGGFFEQRGAASEPDVEGHDVAFADGVDGGVGDLGEFLLEVGVEGAWLVLEDGEGGVVAHGADGFLGLAGHGLEDVFEFLLGVAVEDFAFEDFAFGGWVDGGGEADFAALDAAHAVADPFAVWALAGDAALDFGVVEEFVAFGVDGDHLAGAEAAGFDDVGVVELDQADFGGHDDEAVAGDLVAGGAEAVAVHGGGGDAAVGEGDGGWAVPGFGEAGVVLVEASELGVHVGALLPGFGDEHHHGVEGAAAGGDEQVEDFVEGEGVGAAFGDDGVELGDLFAPEGGFEGSAAGVHPVAVAEQGVDFAVVGDEAEGLGDGPVGQGVGGVALVEEGEGGDGVGVGEVGIEAAELGGDHEALVDDGSGGEGGDVGFAGGVARVGLGEGAIVGFGEAAGEVEGAGELFGGRAGAAAEDELLDGREAVAGPGAEDVGLDRDFAPAERFEAGALGGGGEDGAGALAGWGIDGEEDHGEGEFVEVLEGLAEAFEVGSEGGPGDGDGDAGAVAGLGVGVGRAAVGEADDALDGLADDVVGGCAVDAGDEAGAAGVAEGGGVVQSAVSGGTGAVRHRCRLQVRADGRCRNGDAARAPIAVRAAMRRPPANRRSD